MTKPSEEVQILQDIVDKQTLAEQVDMRNEEFDVLMDRLALYRMSGKEKFFHYLYRTIGIALGLLLLIALLNH
jgi:hypothetical protein